MYARSASVEVFVEVTVEILIKLPHAQYSIIGFITKCEAIDQNANLIATARSVSEEVTITTSCMQNICKYKTSLARAHEIAIPIN